MKRMSFTFNRVFGENWNPLRRSCWSLLLVAFCFSLNVQTTTAHQVQVIPCSLEASPPTSTNVTCTGDDDGTASIVASITPAPPLVPSFFGPTGLVNRLQIDWSNGSTGASVTGLAPGDYTVTATEYVEIFLPIVGGTGEFVNCSSTFPVTILEPTQLVVDVVQTTDATCLGNLDGTATLFATGGTTPYTYSWSSGATTATATGLAAGTYTAEVLDANACSVFFEEIRIFEPKLLEVEVTSFTNVSCNGGSDGSIEISVVGGTAPYSYSWSGNGNIPADNVEDAIGLPEGTYTVVVTDVNGCQAMISQSITQPTPLTVVIDNVLDANCAGNETGSARAQASGGTGNYHYSWSNGDSDNLPAGAFSTATNLHAGGYIVLVTDDNGCTVAAATSIADPNGLSLDVTILEAVSCKNGADGEVKLALPFNPVAGTPPYTLTGIEKDFAFTGVSIPFNEGPSNNVLTVSGFSAGQYRFTAVDDNGCNVTATATVTEPTLLIAEIIHQEDESCPGKADGTATVNATGGTTGYSYAWSNGQASNIATGLTAGTYTVVVTDSELCSTSTSVIIGTTDDVAPSFVTTIPGDETVECDAIPAPFVVLPKWHTTDNCSLAEDITVVYDSTIIDIVCPNTFTIKRKWTITDEAGNTTFHIQKIYVQDTTDPTFTVPADITIECDEPTDPSNTGDVTDQMDNCSDADKVTVEFSDVTLLNGCGGYTGTITRTWTATDECMNDSVQVQVITIVDTTKPVAKCNSFEIFLDENGEASITADQVNNGSTDNCAMVAQLKLSLSKMDFTCADIGENIVTLSVEDPCMNVGTCEAIITVTDNEDPIITCPDDIIINLNPGECERIVDYEVTATDNCEVVVMQIGDLTYTSGDAFPIGGPYVLDYKATDEGDNVVYCSFSVTVNEFVPVSGEIACNDLVHVSLDGDCQAVVGADMVLEGNNYGCYDDYIITIKDANGNVLPSNVVNISHINTTLEITIKDADTGNECWGELFVEDKVDPTFDCPEDLDVYCNSETDPEYTGEPVITSCELSTTVTYEDDYVDFECDGAPMDPAVRARILRTWTVTDESGNVTTCVQKIRILKPVIAEVDFPTNKDEIGGNALDCGDVAADPALTTPEYTGYPTFKGKKVVPGGLCALSIGYKDIELYICEGGSSFEILRTWTIRNMCEPLVPGINPIQHVQSIKVLDTTGPELVCPPSQTLSPDANNCAVNVFLPAAQVSDDCSGYEVWVETPFGTLYSNGGFVEGTFELGSHTVTYYAVDACGNTSSCDYTFEVKDLTPPSAICDQHTVASIGSDGYVSIDAFTFDDGSYDNCSELYFEVRKMTDACHFPPDLAFHEYAEFCCAEIGTTVMVEMRVTDAAGNSNSCMVEVEVQDKLKPLLVCPPYKIIDCTDDYLDLDLTGTAVATDNCDDVTPTFTDKVEIDDCGEGKITRTWSAEDASGNISKCIQYIYVENSSPFFICDTRPRNTPFDDECDYHDSHVDFDGVEWPADIELNTCGNGLSPDELEADFPLDARPQVFKGFCNQVGVGYKDLYLPIQEPACVKILRTWVIIDWCQFDPNGELEKELLPFYINNDYGQGSNGRWEYTQLIKVLNSDAPQIFPGGDGYTPNYEENCGEAYVELYANVTDDCTPVEDIEVSYSISNAGGVFATGSGDNASDAFANGDYVITWTATDGCGNYYSVDFPFKVEDKKKPTPVCINGLATVIMPSSGEVTIWANDFEAGSSFDNCTPYNKLKFSFSSDVTETGRTFSCSDISPDNEVSVEIWVTDENGNQDFCTTYILVQDPNGACPPDPTGTVTPQGSIETEEGLEVEDVTVNLLGAAANMSYTTDASGGFSFGTLPTGNYDIQPSKNLNATNGVTTFDLVLISKHILGLGSLDSPYKVIAADANNSSTVTTFDIVMLRRLILQIDTEFQGTQSSWRFVDANQTFADATNPFPFKEMVNLSNGASDANFVGVKIGDVNGSASPNSLLGTDTRDFEGNLVFSLKNKTIKAGETFTVDFNAKDFNNTLGYQFSLGFDNSKVAFVDLATNLTGLTENNFGLALLEEGVITTSWNSHEAVNVEDNSTVFSLTFTATETVTTSELFKINSRYTVAEAYNGSDLYNVALAFNGEIAANKFELYQNTPNPFKDVTAISFNLPEAATTTLKIYDVAGKVLKVVEVEGAKGFNEVKVNRADLSGTGVLYYQVETAAHTATMKMILVD